MVMHERLHPKQHRFVYPVFLLRLDLDELEAQKSPLNSLIFGVNKFRPLSIRTRDYGPRDGSQLFTWVNRTLREHGSDAAARVELQSFPRVFGYAFNPISLWYCFDSHEHMFAVIAEVNNTFGEHHFYLLKTQNEQGINSLTRLQSKKTMHVSPFCEVKGHYEFQFRDSNSHAVVKIDYVEEQELTLKTAIAASKTDFNVRNLINALAKQPLLTFGVFWRIHWQALLLWIKAVPFFRLPVAPSQNITIGTPIREEQ
jgi:DUF1365 family protein